MTGAAAAVSTGGTQPVPMAPAPAEGDALGAWMRRHVSAHGYTLDPAQEATLPSFGRVFDGLAELERADRSLIRRLARRRSVRGLYLWGGVGRGKSFLMDTFFAAASVARKKRIHFHRFMQEIHHNLRDLQGRANPMREVARLIAKDARLLCLDEFHVTDITDAMLLAASTAIADVVTEPNPSFIVPSVFDPAVAKAVADAVRGAARVVRA
jgi:cell division protein ZapE